MIIDSLLDFGSVNLGGGTATCPDVVDVVKPGDAMGHELYFHAVTGKSPAPAGGTSVVIKLQTSDTENFSEAMDLLTTPSIKLADMGAGTMIYSGRMPLGCKRYLRAQVVAAGTFSAGSVRCFLTDDLQRSYE